jgi:hypothetical protein
MMAKMAKKALAVAKCQQGTNTYLVISLAVWHLARVGRWPFGQKSLSCGQMPTLIYSISEGIKMNLFFD